MDKQMDVFLGSGSCWQRGAGPSPEGQGSAEQAWTQHGQACSSPWRAVKRRQALGLLPSWMKTLLSKWLARERTWLGQGHLRVLPSP